MIVGDPSLVAIESVITKAYERRGSRALGLFVVHVKSQRYGVYASDASMLGVSFDQIGRRIAARGTHTAPYSKEPDAHRIATAFREVIYTGATNASYFGMTPSEFEATLSLKHVEWLTDEEFDDGSYILQFDIDDQVRIIAFTCDLGGHINPATLGDAWIDANQFYDVLQIWHDRFLAEWASFPKTAEI